MNKCPICETEVNEKYDYCPNCAWEFEYYFDELSDEEREKYNYRLSVYQKVNLKLIEEEVSNKSTFFEESTNSEKYIASYTMMLKYRDINNIPSYFFVIAIILNTILIYALGCQKGFFILFLNIFFFFPMIFLLWYGIFSLKPQIVSMKTVVPKNIYTQYNNYEIYNNHFIKFKQKDEQEKYIFGLVEINRIIEEGNSIQKSINEINIFWMKIFVFSCIYFLIGIGLFSYLLDLHIIFSNFLIMLLTQLFIFLLLLKNRKMFS